MTVLLTGAAGFIGYHVADALLRNGRRVLAIDSVNDYYDVGLKRARLDKLIGRDGFSFHQMDITDEPVLRALLAATPEITHVVHLAAQPGVRYSLEAPRAYIRANLDAQLVMLEACLTLDRLEHFVFASSSSVYGNSTRLPFALGDPVDQPASLYGATKRGAELISSAYSQIHGLPQTGLRFFTVYGPWGRPDMAPSIFTRKILAGEPIQVFNRGELRRDFTYIDDIVAGILGCLDKVPTAGESGAAPFKLYNLGNHKSIALMDFIAALEQALGTKAELELLPMQPADVKETFADISEAARDFGFSPRINLEEGLPRFVDWYRTYHSV